MNQTQQLQELVRHIVKRTIKELMGSSSSQFNSNVQQQGTGTFGDLTQPPVDAMTPMEKAKIEREQEKKRREALKQGEAELKSAKKEMEFQKQKVDQSKRYKIPTLTKQIQSLKGGQTGTSLGI